VHTSSHALLRICEPPRDITEADLAADWGASGEVNEIYCGLECLVQGELQFFLLCEVGYRWYRTDRSLGD
jgi:hypothetical protein